MQKYWNIRFQEESKVWGMLFQAKQPYMQKKCLEKKGVKTILVPGAGYGRNAEFFSSEGFKVDGIEISDIAFTIEDGDAPKSEILKTLKIASQNEFKVKYYHGLVLDIPFSGDIMMLSTVLTFFIFSGK